MRRSAAVVLFLVLASCSSLRLFEVQENDTLYFGTNRPNGAVVSDAEWRDFVEQVIVPEFSGFTEWQGVGYWKREREAAHIVLVTHPRSAEANGKIQRIIDEYKRRFTQEAVFWTKEPAAVPLD